LHEAYAGDKNLISFEGDHNSPRPEFFFNSVVNFFNNTLQVSSLLRDDNKFVPSKLSPSEKLLFAPQIGPKKKFKGNMGELPFDPSVLNIMSMAGKSVGDNGDFDDFHAGHDGDEDRHISINQSAMMTNARPRVEQVSQLHSGGDEDYVHVQPDRVQ
jgi:hypothetical protein